MLEKITHIYTIYWRQHHNEKVGTKWIRELHIKIQNEAPIGTNAIASQNLKPNVENLRKSNNYAIT